MFKFSKFVRWV